MAAIVVVCLPALKSFVQRMETISSSRGDSNSNSRSNFKAYGSASSHIKLSSGRDPYATTTIAAAGEESGSEVELNDLQRSNVIYKSDRVSIKSHRRGDMDTDGRGV